MDAGQPEHAQRPARRTQHPRCQGACRQEERRDDVTGAAAHCREGQGGSRVGSLGLDPQKKAGRLSGGQRAQLALTLAIAKRPRLLLLDEPVASLDPLARRHFLRQLMEAVAEQELTVVLSSHLVSDLERTCDYVVVLVDSRVQLAGDVEELLAEHHRLIGPRNGARLPAGWEVIEESHTERQSTLLVHCSNPIFDPAWAIEPVALEDLVLAYMARGDRDLSQRIGLVGLP